MKGRTNSDTTNYNNISNNIMGLPWWLSWYHTHTHTHTHTQICMQIKRPGFDPWVWEISWQREQQLIPVFFPGEYHGQRSLEGYSPWGCKKVRHDLENKPLPNSIIAN